MKPVFKRSAAALAIAGLSIGLAAPTAFAVDPEAEVVVDGTTGETVADVPVEMLNLVNYEQKGSITVNKTTAPQGDRGDGNILDPVPSPALPGVTFELHKVMDIDNAEDFKIASSYTVANAPVGEPVKTGETDANGQIVFDNLPVGLYKVVETKAPDGVAMAAPYLVYVPMTNPANLSEWNYDVVTYPKNSKSETTKTVKDVDANVGDEITYTISSDIPVVTENAVTQYQVHDQLDAANVETSKDQVSVSVGGTALVQGTDYDVNVSDEQKVEIVFLETGLEKLTEAKSTDQAAKVETTIKATVLAIAGTDGVASNKAEVWHNNPYETHKIEKRPSNEVNTYWAKLRVLKTGTEKTPLEGAEFEVYRCTDAANLGDKITIDHDNDPATPAVEKWTTGEDGKLVIDGLHVTDFENNGMIDSKTYCLVETKAPKGYELLTDPVPVTLNRAELIQVAEDTAKVSLEKTIENVPSNSVKLPLTGGVGIGIFAALGALIIGAGAFAARRNSSQA